MPDRALRFQRRAFLVLLAVLCLGHLIAGTLQHSAYHVSVAIFMALMLQWATEGKGGERA